ncbi:MAG: polysaccharide deacetylase family protein, partial [Candidatus Krumholzibacteriia bacterium]
VLPAALVDAFDAPLPQVQRLREAAAFLKALPDEERQALMQRLLEELAPDPGESMAEPLRWDEVRRMRAQGMHIGAHGIRHAILTSMAPEEARRELAGSLEGVGRRIGAAVTEFAYPNGDVDEGVATLAREAGARLGFTMQAHENRPDHDPLRLARYNVCEDTSRSAFAQFSRAYFWCEITGVFDFVLRRESRRRSEGA